MVQIILIRPGSTDYDEQGRIQGNLDIPLSSQGNEEVKALGEQLRSQGITVLYASDTEPALQTASALAEIIGVKVKKLDKMENLDHGLWQGMLVDDVKRKQPKVYRQWHEQPEMICPPEGETLSEAHHRVQQALSRILKKHKQGKIGLVLPEPIASVVHSYLGKGSLGDVWKRLSNCGSWAMIDVEPEALVHSSE